MQTVSSGFRAAHAADADWHALVDSCLASLGAVPDDANIGFAYATDALAGAYPDIMTALADRTGIAQWCGTVGFGVCATGIEYFDRPALVVMIGAMGEDDFRILPTVERPGDPLPEPLVEWIDATHPALGIVHADPRNGLLPDLLAAVSDDSDCFLVGGITASRGALPQAANGPTEGGVSGVLFAGDVGVVTGLSQGCSPIGEVRRVTEGQENVLMTLDDQTALDALKADIGEAASGNLARAAANIHAAIPIPGSDTGDYLVRNMVGVDPAKGWLAIGERVQVGDRIMFVRRDADSAMTDLRRMLDDLWTRAGAAPRAALYFTCVARGPNLFGPDSAELGAIRETIGDIPLAGFFANGEIFHNRLYGYTGVLTLFL